MVNTRNILLIGKTGNGKSALANVITGTDEFREGRYSVSQTKKIQTEEFEYPKLSVLDDKAINNAENIENAQTSAKQYIESLFKERNKVEPSNLDKGLWKNKSSWEEYLKELKTKDEILKFIKLLKEELTIKYRITDTLGISDTKEVTEMSLERVFYNLAKVGYVVKDGLSQIFLVTDGSDKSWKQEISLYNLLKETVFDKEIAQYTTIVKTRFASFEEEEECEKDRQILSRCGGEVSEFINELIEKGSNKIIYVDNPPVDLVISEREENINNAIKKMIRDNKINKVVLKKLGKVFEKKELSAETREISREVLLKHLVAYDNVCKPANLDNLNKIIAKEWKDKKLLKEKINKEFIKHIKERGSNLKKEVKDELKRLQEEIEEREMKQTRLKGDELTKQIGSQLLIRELKELNSYLPEDERFIRWKEEINQLKEEKIGERERKLVSEIIIGRENIIEVIERNIRKKRELLQEVKNNHEGKIKEATKKNKKFINSPNLFETNNDKDWILESLEEVCQAQTSLIKSETELEIIKKALEKVENYKEQLGQQLEARVEILPK